MSVCVVNTRTRWRTMNEEFSTLHKAELCAVLKISSLLYHQQVRVFLNKHELTASSFLIQLYISRKVVGEKSTQDRKVVWIEVLDEIVHALNMK